MSIQHSVVFGMLLTIINKKKVTRDQLAEKFEISKSTVNRYINILLMAQIPLISLPGRFGGISIAEDFVLEKGFLTHEEKARLLACIKATAPTFSDNINQTLLQKISDSGDRKGNGEFLISSDTLYIDALGWTNPKFYKSKISIINNAITNSLSLDMQYCNKYGETSQRIFDPYCLALKEGVWYVYGICHKRNEYRIFKLSRIDRLLTTQNHFVRRTDADVSSKLSNDFDDMSMTISIEFSNLRLHDIQEWLGDDSVSKNNLKYTATAVVHAGSGLIAKLMSMGSDIKVLSPASLRDDLIKECNRMINYNS